LSVLEKDYADFISINIEIATLEEAYLNIAKHEDVLLKSLQVSSNQEGK
jgi:hypothetical protein